MKLNSQMQEGIFLERPNRFAAWVEVNGSPAMAHVPNSGRMRELLQQGSRVLLTPRSGPGRKTAYDLSLVELGHTLVSIDSRLPPDLIQEAFYAGKLHQFSQYDWLRREVWYSHSRLDMVMGSGAPNLYEQSGLCYLEMKSVTLVQDGIALFPDAPTSRGVRHLNALSEAVCEGHRAAVVFVVQREDAHVFRPNDQADPLFGKALREAQAARVEIYAYNCQVSQDEIVLSEKVYVKMPVEPVPG